MHPALSVILFTSASGAGYMLLSLMGVLAASGLLAPERGFGLAGFAIGFGATGLGLLASTFHLGHPERAWRAFSQWRSSWLSREGILALATFLPAIAFAWSWVVEGRIFLAAGVATALLGIATIAATAMIYASLKPVKAWHNGWTLPLYLANGLCSGALWAAALAGWCGQKAAPMLAVIAVLASILSSVVTLIYWRHIDRAQRDGKAGDATGLGRFGTVTALLSPHSLDNYLMKEMGFRIARKHAAKLRSVALWSGFIVPGALTLGSGQAEFQTGAILGPALLTIAVLLHALGTLAQRWLFFAEARHRVVDYYRED